MRGGKIFETFVLLLGRTSSYESMKKLHRANRGEVVDIEANKLAFQNILKKESFRFHGFMLFASSLVKFEQDYDYEKWLEEEVEPIVMKENLMRVECESAEEMLHIFHYGLTNKVMGSHKMNLTSSRSHTIFSVTVE